jgi:uncharacterized protein (DUF302 family)
MKPMSYNAELKTDFDSAIEQVTAALKEEGFGIISRIDMHTTFKEKIDKDIPPHTILGACNPGLAHKAVTALPEASLMLPCNVTVQEQEDHKIKVRIVSPEIMMATAGLDEDPDVKEVGEEADIRLRRVAESLNR